MKFAHALKDALEKDCYPATWVAAAVPYGQLKKCLKRVSMLSSEQNNPLKTGYSKLLFRHNRQWQTSLH
jgi:hypothetical protein